ncbi:MAG TPA: Clp protease N-terminal domain-containing protein [Pseudonocardia sp.]|jgi:hypothetical protein
MASFPVSLDSLIAYVQKLHPEDGPLDRLATAATVSAELDNQADALLGHFVDQARRAGASWTQIGAHMGVSKQAVRKRFVPHWDGSDPIPEGQLYSRCTLRARNTLLAAGEIAERGRHDQVEPAHLVAGLLVEPHGLAAVIIHKAGITNEQVCAALDVPAEHVQPRAGHPDPRADAAALPALPLAPPAREALRNTVSAALNLGHNYIGTEHILLGTLATEGGTADALHALGLDPARVTEALEHELTAVRAKLFANPPGH